MKVSVQSKNSSRPSFALSDVLPVKEVDFFVQQGAKTLRDALLFELDQTTLDGSQKAEIARSIKISTLDDGEMSVSIHSSLAADIEFGTHQLDEQPWILRATQTALAKIKSMQGRGERQA